MARPVLTDSTIDWIVAAEKPITDPRWRDKLLPPKVGLTVRERRLDLEPIPDGQPVGGTLQVFVRQNVRESVLYDWTVGLLYSDYADNTYPILRCNSPHPTVHVNRIEKTRFAGSPHVHYLTERYQLLPRAKEDGYAEPTDAFTTIDEALEHLGALVNLTPAGMLWL